MDVGIDDVDADPLAVLAGLVNVGARVVTDGHTGYGRLPAAGYRWTRIPHPRGGLKAGGSGRATPAVDGAISLFRRWLLGTYNKPPASFAPYLAEFTFRSEFRGRPSDAFTALLALLVSPA